MKSQIDMFMNNKYRVIWDLDNCKLYQKYQILFDTVPSSLDLAVGDSKETASSAPLSALLSVGSVLSQIFETL